MTIKVLEKTPGCLPEIIKVGDWIDLTTSEDYTFKCPHAKTLHKHKENNSTENFRDVVFSYSLIDLGVVIQIPEGYEALLLPRSSTFKKWGLLQTNSQGVIDQTYCGPNDVWKFPVLATRNIFIPKGTPIAQFRIQLSQKATMWQKIKWFFSSKVKIERISEVKNSDRGGFGTGSDMYRSYSVKIKSTLNHD